MPQLNKTPIRVMIVDDIRETRKNLRQVFSPEPDIEFAGAADDGEQAILMAAVLKMG